MQVGEYSSCQVPSLSDLDEVTARVEEIHTDESGANFAGIVLLEALDNTVVHAFTRCPLSDAQGLRYTIPIDSVLLPVHVVPNCIVGVM